MEFANKNIMILGLMRSGIAIAELLISRGVKPLVCDQKNNDDIRKNLGVLKDDTYINLAGKDPQDYLDEIDILVISPGVPINSNIVTKALEKNIEVIGELELSSQLSNNTLLAVTGTNGKTTSVSLLGRIFQNAGKVAFVAGNIGYPLSSAVLKAKNDDILIAEVSSFQLETTNEFHPAVAALLNITEDHLNRHATMEEYIRLKFKIFQKQNERDIAVLNYDDKIIKANSHLVKSQIIWFSRTAELKQGAFIKNNEIVVSYLDKYKTICNIDNIKIPGPHNLENALAMTAIAVSMNIPSAVIRHTLMTFEGVEHRIESVATINGINYINDSKGTNTDSTAKAVESMQSPSIIILGGYDKNTDFTSLCKFIVESPHIKHAVLIGQTANKIYDCFKDLNYHQVTNASSLKEAVIKATELAQNGYNVLLSPACASFDMFVDYEERGRAFKSIVKEL